MRGRGALGKCKGNSAAERKLFSFSECVFVLGVGEGAGGAGQSGVTSFQRESFSSVWQTEFAAVWVQ